MFLCQIRIWIYILSTSTCTETVPRIEKNVSKSLLVLFSIQNDDVNDGYMRSSLLEKERERRCKQQKAREAGRRYSGHVNRRQDYVTRKKVMMKYVTGKRGEASCELLVNLNSWCSGHKQMEKDNSSECLCYVVELIV